DVYERQTLDEFLLLYWVVKRPGGSKSAAFGYAGLGPTTGGQMLARLAARGWLAAGPDPADGRRARLAPTPAGHAAFAAAAAGLTAAAEALVAPLAGAEVVRLEQLLNAAVGSAPQLAKG
ncbi:MarR family transcriptional regulator, partial [Hymenobacter sp. BT523]